MSAADGDHRIVVMVTSPAATDGHPPKSQKVAFQNRNTPCALMHTESLVKNVCKLNKLTRLLHPAGRPSHRSAAETICAKNFVKSKTCAASHCAISDSAGQSVERT